MPAQPAMLTFNELNGREVREVLENRCRDTFEKVPYFQEHITLPRVKMTLSVKLEIYSDQKTPDTISIGDTLTVVVEHPEILEFETVDAAAPIPGGKPPDQIRELHGLPVSEPRRGPRETGGHIVVADQMPETKYAGLVRDPHNFADPLSGRGTFVTIDQGPAGLNRGEMNRQSFEDMRHGIPAPRKLT